MPPALFSRNLQRTQPPGDSQRSLLEPKDAVIEIRRQNLQNMIKYLTMSVP